MSSEHQLFSLAEACIRGCEEQVARCLTRMRPQSRLDFRLQPVEKSPLHAAAMHGHAGCVSMLLELGAFGVDEVDQTGATPMAYACENGHLHVVQILSSYVPSST